MPLTEAVLKQIAKYDAYKNKFLNFFHGGIDDENPRFLLAAMDFQRNPVLGNAILVRDEYILANAPRSVNITAGTRDAIEAYITLAGVRGTAFFAGHAANVNIFPVRKTTFDQAVIEVISLIDNNVIIGLTQSKQDEYEAFLAYVLNPA